MNTFKLRTNKSERTQGVLCQFGIHSVHVPQKSRVRTGATGFISIFKLAIVPRKINYYIILFKVVRINLINSIVSTLRPFSYNKFDVNKTI